MDRDTLEALLLLIHSGGTSPEGLATRYGLKEAEEPLARLEEEGYAAAQGGMYEPTIMGWLAGHAALSRWSHEYATIYTLYGLEAATGLRGLAAFAHWFTSDTRWQKHLAKAYKEYKKRRCECPRIAWYKTRPPGLKTETLMEILGDTEFTRAYIHSLVAMQLLAEPPRHLKKLQRTAEILEEAKNPLRLLAYNLLHGHIWKQAVSKPLNVYRLLIFAPPSLPEPYAEKHLPEPRLPEYTAPETRKLAQEIIDSIKTDLNLIKDAITALDLNLKGKYIETHNPLWLQIAITNAENK